MIEFETIFYNRADIDNFVCDSNRCVGHVNVIGTNDERTSNGKELIGVLNVSKRQPITVILENDNDQCYMKEFINRR